jgi:hypothetical protein
MSDEPARGSIARTVPMSVTSPVNMRLRIRCRSWSGREPIAP